MNTKTLSAAAMLGVALLAGCTNNRQITMLPYPETPRQDVTDNYFGTTVADPYRWRENPQDPQTVRWIEDPTRGTVA